jgi:NADH-quinone oxidoreductase subunit E
MADRTIEPDSPELRARWGNFAWTQAWADKARAALARYPEGRQRSAVMAYLDFAQRQVGEETNTQGWLPIPVIEFVARELGMPVVRVLEVATFYTMYNLVPVGRFHVQVCGTTPCMLRGSDDIIATCKKRGMHAGHTTDDGLWTFTEVECMGNCASAPMVQINDDNYEDLTPERMDAILDALARGDTPKVGTQEPGRHTVEPTGALSSLTAMVEENHDYRGEWA